MLMTRTAQREEVKPSRYLFNLPPSYLANVRRCCLFFFRSVVVNPTTFSVSTAGCKESVDSTPQLRLALYLRATTFKFLN
jgi:hypothetical protein